MVPVGLFGLQIKISFVLLPTRSAIFFRSCLKFSPTGTEQGFAPISLLAKIYSEKVGQACITSSPGFRKASPILESELKDPSLSTLAAAHSDTIPSSSKKVLMVSNATEEEAKVLGISPDTPVFLLIQTIYNAESKIIAWGKSLYRGDRYKLTTYEGWNIEDIKNS
jgi:hypothetical protein